MAQQRFQAGLMDRVGTLSELGGKNSYGEKSKTTLVPLLERVYCQKVEVSGQESDSEAGRQTAFNRVDFIIRWRANVKPVQIWTCEGVQYDIKAVLEIGRRMYLKLQCQRRD